MKFFTTPYHFNLLKDNERLTAFNEAINDYYKRHINYSNCDKGTEKLEKTAFDIGCGTGVLSFFASKYFRNIIAIDIDYKIIDCARKSFENIENSDNINFHFSNVLDSNFQEKADLIICEMLDTGLVDEEEVPVLNYLQKYLKKNGEIIPKGIINIAEPIFMERNNIHYDDDFNNQNYEILGNYVKYSEFDFSNLIDIKFNTMIEFEISVDSKVNGIKITTFTKLNQDIICGPTSMMNPPLLIPVEEKNVKKGEKIKIFLEYIMGGGLKTIKTSIID
ncbi:MAG: methyltransferase domain-containing protein [Methanobacteriaceae archaeon]|jgi:predicted RNA methylase|nr:methyltransferase domain-containing protein [Candidatus Methanorudis spinitermitis]